MEDINIKNEDDIKITIQNDPFEKLLDKYQNYADEWKTYYIIVLMFTNIITKIHQNYVENTEQLESYLNDIDTISNDTKIMISERMKSLTSIVASLGKDEISSSNDSTKM